jgi:hypothetical protein
MKESGRLHFQAVLYPRKEAQVTSEPEARWAQEPFWMRQRKEKPVPLPRIEPHLSSLSPSYPCSLRVLNNVHHGNAFIHSFIHQWLYSPLLIPGLFFSFVNIFTLTVGLLGRVIGASQGRYLHTRQHKHRINAHASIHALSGIRTHDPRVRASEDRRETLTTGKLTMWEQNLTVQNHQYQRSQCPMT